MIDNNKKGTYSNEESANNKATRPLKDSEKLNEISNNERHNENARASASLKSDYPRMDTDNL